MTEDQQLHELLTKILETNQNVVKQNALILQALMLPALMTKDDEK